MGGSNGGQNISPGSNTQNISPGSSTQIVSPGPYDQSEMNFYKTFYMNDPNRNQFVDSGAMNAGFNYDQWNWLNQGNYQNQSNQPSYNSTPQYQYNTNNIYNPTTSNTTTPFNYQNPFSGTVNPTSNSSGSPLPTQQGYEQYLNQFKNTLPNYQIQNPFGVTPYGFTGSPMTTPQQQAPQAPQGPDKYDQRYIDKMLKSYQGYDPTINTSATPIPAATQQRQQEMLQALQRGEIPEQLKKGTMYQRMVLDRRANDQQHAAEEAAKPWFLQQEKPGMMDQMSPDQRQQYQDARRQAQIDYYTQNPSEIPKGWLDPNAAGNTDALWRSIAGDTSLVQDQVTNMMSGQQQFQDLYNQYKADFASGKREMPDWYERKNAADISDSLKGQPAYIRDMMLSLQSDAQKKGLESPFSTGYINPTDLIKRLESGKGLQTEQELQNLAMSQAKNWYISRAQRNLNRNKGSGSTYRNKGSGSTSYSANPYTMNINQMYQLPETMTAGPWSYMNSMQGNPFWQYSNLNPNMILSSLFNYNV